MSETQNRLKKLLQQVRRVGPEQVPPEELVEMIQLQGVNLRTGPEVGERAPDFTLPDWNGRSWSLASLLGPEGLLLAFQRSADW